MIRRLMTVAARVQNDRGAQTYKLQMNWIMRTWLAAAPEKSKLPMKCSKPAPISRAPFILGSRACGHSS